MSVATFATAETGAIGDELYGIPNSYATIISSSVLGGTQCYQLAPTSSGSTIELTAYAPASNTASYTTLSVATAWYGGRFSYTVLPALSQNLIKIMNTGNGQKMAVQINANGSLSVLNSSGATQYTSLPGLITTSYVYEIGFTCGTNGVSAPWSLYLANITKGGAGNLIASGATNTSATNHGGVTWGSTVANDTWTLLCKSMYIDTAQFNWGVIGRGLRPNAYGPSQQWTNVGSISATVTASQATSSVYLTTSIVGQRDNFYTATSSTIVSSSATVVGAKVFCYFADSVYSSSNIANPSVFSSSVYTEGASSTYLSSLTLAPFQLEVNNDPNTGAPWTVAGLDAAAFGMVASTIGANGIHANNVWKLVLYNVGLLPGGASGNLGLMRCG